MCWGTVVRNTIVDMGSDNSQTRIYSDKPYIVLLNWDDWRNAEGRKLRTQNWQTDRSKTGTNSSIGVYEENQSHKICKPLGRYTTIFQTEKTNQLINSQSLHTINNPNRNNYLTSYSLKSTQLAILNMVFFQGCQCY